MRNRYVGILIIGIAIIFLFLVMSFNNALETIVNETCTHGTTCPMQITLKTQQTISYSLITLLIFVGTFISFFMKENSSGTEKDSLTDEKRKKKIECLAEPEKTIMTIIQRENGSIYQSDLIKKTKLSKVKITRLLDKLEGMHLIERKRRGMTNIIIIK